MTQAVTSAVPEANCTPPQQLRCGWAKPSYLREVHGQRNNPRHIAGDQHGQGQQADGTEVIHFAALCPLPLSEIQQHPSHLGPHASARADAEVPGGALGHGCPSRASAPRARGLSAADSAARGRRAVDRAGIETALT